MDGSVENDASTDLSCYWARQTRNDFVAKNVLHQFQRKSGPWGCLPWAAGCYRTPPFPIPALVAFLEIGEPSCFPDRLKSLSKRSPKK